MLSIIILCYNEEAALPLFYDALRETLRTMPDMEYELLFIDDGSTDGTLDLLKGFAADPHVYYLSFSRNFGQEAAMYAGFRNAKGDYITVMDADLQEPPELLPRMLEIIQTGEYDMVCAKRSDRKGEPPLRSWCAKRFYKMINRRSDIHVEPGARNYRLMTRQVADVIISMGERSRFSKGIFGWIGFRTCWLSFEHVERVAGESKFNFWKLFRYGVDGIVNFSQTPLRITTILGSIFSVAAVVALVLAAVFGRAEGTASVWWLILLCVVILIEGIQMILHGITNRYIANLTQEAKQRPLYIIAQTNREDAELVESNRH